DVEKRSGILNGCFNLEPIANNSGITKQLADMSGVIRSHLFGIETVEGFPVSSALFENRFPTESCLCAFQDKEFEQDAVVVLRHAPFCVVIRNSELGGGPAAAPDGFTAGFGHRGYRSSFPVGFSSESNRSIAPWRARSSRSPAVSCSRCASTMSVCSLS